jgi:tRNA G37 N-methylase Trm5
VLDRIVSLQVGQIENEFRVFNMEVLAGEPLFETEVSQHGCRFRLDFSKVCGMCVRALHNKPECTVWLCVEQQDVLSGCVLSKPCRHLGAEGQHADAYDVQTALMQGSLQVYYNSQPNAQHDMHMFMSIFKYV